MFTLNGGWRSHIIKKLMVSSQNDSAAEIKPLVLLAPLSQEFDRRLSRQPFKQ